LGCRLLSVVHGLGLLAGARGCQNLDQSFTVSRNRDFARVYDFAVDFLDLIEGSRAGAPQCHRRAGGRARARHGVVFAVELGVQSGVPGKSPGDAITFVRGNLHHKSVAIFPLGEFPLPRQPRPAGDALVSLVVLKGFTIRPLPLFTYHQSLAVGRESGSGNPVQNAIGLMDSLPCAVVNLLPGSHRAKHGRVLFFIHPEFVGLTLGCHLHFSGGRLFVSDDGAGDVALREILFPLADEGIVGSRYRSNGRHNDYNYARATKRASKNTPWGRVIDSKPTGKHGEIIDRINKKTREKGDNRADVRSEFDQGMAVRVEECMLLNLGDREKIGEDKNQRDIAHTGETSSINAFNASANVTNLCPQPS
jgi:hypothetical protein